MVTAVGTPGVPRGHRRAFGLARPVDVLIGVAALVVAALTVAGWLAPLRSAPVDPAAVSPDGGLAFRFSPGFSARWPYAVPSHPVFALAPGDVRLFEDGRGIGALQPDHSIIRETGNGAYNLWEGALWFSSSDGSDPRVDGHDYRVDVRTRLAPSAADLRRWGIVVLLGLLLYRGARPATHGLLAAWSALDRRLGLARLAERVPLTFGRTFAIASAAALGAFAWGNLTHPMPLLLGADSMGYIRPGLAWAAGHDMAGQSSRDLGYPWLTWVALRFGSLSLIPRLQLFMVAAALALALGVFYIAAAGMARRLRRAAALPGSAAALLGSAAAAGYVALFAAHDLFMLDIDSGMAEAPHALPTALALLLFVGGWTAKGGQARLILLSLASLAAYASAMFKPNSLLVLVLCLAGLIVAGLRDRRSLRSPPVLAVGLAAAICGGAIQRFDAHVTPAVNDFGPKTLFCNHLDVIEPVIDATTPARRTVRSFAQEVLTGTRGWPVMGYNGDGCMYGADFTAAIAAASASDDMAPGRWEMREFVLAVVRNPIRYGRDVAKQAWAYLSHPMNGLDTSVRSGLTEAEWGEIGAAVDLAGVPHDPSGDRLDNWLSFDHPRLAAAGKSVLRSIDSSFALVTLSGTLLAFVAFVRFRGKRDATPEIVLLTTALFVGSFVATTALSHTFDIDRYATDALPLSLLWWLLGLAYLLQAIVLAGSTAGRGAHRGARNGSPHFPARTGDSRSPPP